jgi:hypothetical protein
MTTGVNSGSDVYINLDADYSQALENLMTSAHRSWCKCRFNRIENFRDYVFGRAAPYFN